MRESQIKAVHQRDFENLLRSLGVYEAVCSNTATCFFCQSAINQDSISAVFPFEGSVCFCCEKPKCCNALIDMEREEGDYG